MKYIDLHENNIYIRFAICEDGNFKLLHFSSLPLDESKLVSESISEGFPFLSLSLSGYDRPYERHGNKMIVTAPGFRMKYVSHEDSRNALGRLFTIYLEDEVSGVTSASYLQFYDSLSILRIWHTITNTGTDTQTLEYIANFHYEGIEKEGNRSQNDKLSVWIPHNGWQRELNWKHYTLSDLGMELVQEKNIQRSSNHLHITNTGNWSSKEYLPMGYLENTEVGSGLFWQIEHNGSWHWEIGDQNGHLYLALGGPNELYSSWFKDLKPGDSFTTVPAAVGVTAKGMDDAFSVLTSYRRLIRRPNEDNEKLPVIFNDYMNCLWGHPTAAEEFPLIDAAAEVGSEYFVIDAGWYADGDWWDSVGEWQESRKRFPNGVREVTDAIRAKGMIPGVWLEPEVMGIHCELTSKVPQDWFFVRHGKKVYDRSRYQLDYRNPEVITYINSVVDRLIQEYGVGYIKTDYNIEPGIGTELYADSPGDGMLQHERAYLAWLDDLFKRYPDLILENCSSGGLRMDYAMLSRLSIQSTSDTDNYLMYPIIAVNAPTAVTPEQAAVWSYPMNHEEELSDDELVEETIFNMINAMMLRIHQSGHLAKLDDKRKALVKSGIQVYKSIRSDIKTATPFWPLGLADYADGWVCLGLKTNEKAYVAVWKRDKNAETTCDIVLPDNLLEGKDIESVKCIYPVEQETLFEAKGRNIKIAGNKGIMARLFEVK